MEKNNSCVFGLVLLILMSVGTIANAQDSGSPSFDAYEKDPADAVFFSPGDSAEATTPQQRDSASLRMPLKRNVYKPAPVVPKEKIQPTEPTDNSILSFNFLYYLIQKYKMQDIVD